MASHSERCPSPYDRLMPTAIRMLPHSETYATNRSLLKLSLRSPFLIDI